MVLKKGGLENVFLNEVDVLSILAFSHSDSDFSMHSIRTIQEFFYNSFHRINSKNGIITIWISQTRDQ